MVGFCKASRLCLGMVWRAQCAGPSQGLQAEFICRFVVVLTVAAVGAVADSLSTCSSAHLPPMHSTIQQTLQAHRCCHQGGWSAGAGTPPGLPAVLLPGQEGEQRPVLGRGEYFYLRRGQDTQAYIHTQACTCGTTATERCLQFLAVMLGEPATQMLGSCSQSDACMLPCCTRPPLSTYTGPARCCWCVQPAAARHQRHPQRQGAPL